MNRVKEAQIDEIKARIEESYARVAATRQHIKLIEAQTRVELARADSMERQGSAKKEDK